eukprot:TRINITY_DN1231_c0_g2_i1.p1 TRINITY_DN1231_c0_g2~~TRINITY_DN1231_c0_g2_i1.p1  ORF type:complete len:356 (-),score=33.19 TRINITY_DN1231_c0_g2_i1:400-1467(-)
MENTRNSRGDIVINVHESSGLLSVASKNTLPVSFRTKFLLFIVGSVVICGLICSLALTIVTLSYDRVTSITFIAIGDFGREGQFNQSVTAEQMGSYCLIHKCPFVVSVGDNFYPVGVSSTTDPQWKTSFEDVYTASSLQVPWYVALGNHDYMRRSEAELQYAADHPNGRWRMPARYYTHQFGIDGEFSARLIMLDTSPLDTEYLTDPHLNQTDLMQQNATAQWEWLVEQLQTSHRYTWDIVIGHHPVYSASYKQPDTPDLVNRLKPILNEFAIPVYISGHAHDMQHIWEHEQHRTQYVISGAGSQIRPTYNESFALPVYYTATNGFVAVKLSKNLFRVELISCWGQLLHSFEIAK